MKNPAAEQAQRVSTVILKDKQLRPNFEDALLSDFVKTAESYSYAKKNMARLQITEIPGGTAVKFEIIIDGWKPVNYLP